MIQTIQKISFALSVLVLTAAAARAQSPSVTLKPTQGSIVNGTITVATMGTGVHFTGTLPLTNSFPHRYLLG